MLHLMKIVIHYVLRLVSKATAIPTRIGDVQLMAMFLRSTVEDAVSGFGLGKTCVLQPVARLNVLGIDEVTTCSTYREPWRRGGSISCYSLWEPSGYVLRVEKLEVCCTYLRETCYLRSMNRCLSTIRSQRDFCR